jgi:hypothetical protein
MADIAAEAEKVRVALDLSRISAGSTDGIVEKPPHQ